MYKYPINQCADESDEEYLLRCRTWDRIWDILYERSLKSLLAAAESNQPVELAAQQRRKRKPKKAAA